MKSEPTDARTVEQARAFGLRLLARREYAREELCQRLLTAQFPQAIAERVVEALAAEGLQSDLRFVVALTRRRVGQGYGPYRLRAELRQRGIEDRDDPLGPEACHEAMVRAHGKRFGSEPPVSPEDWSRRERFLIRRGFSRSEVITFLKRLGSPDALHS